MAVMEPLGLVVMEQLIPVTILLQVAAVAADITAVAVAEAIALTLVP